jgi:hypothetical protein
LSLFESYELGQLTLVGSSSFSPVIKASKIRKLSDVLLYLTGVSYSRSMGKAAAGEQPMYHRMVWQTLRLGLLVTFVVVAVSACGGGGGQEQANKPRPLPEEEKALRPDVYRSEEFKPSFSFRVGKGWTNSPPEGL